MAQFVAGDVVVTRFPLSNLKSYKVRPALVLANGDFGDLILCQITSFSDGNLQTISINNSSYTSGGLPIDSFIRPDKIFTAGSSIIQKKAAHIKPDVLNVVKQNLAQLFNITKTS